MSRGLGAIQMAVLDALSTEQILALSTIDLEHFPTGMNRLGFPKRRESDSSWMLAREVSMHDQGAFR